MENEIIAAEVTQAPPPVNSQPAEKLYEVVVDGKNQKVTEKELLKGYSHGSAASKRMQEAAELTKTSQGVFDVLNNSRDLKGFLALAETLGVDYKAHAQELVLQQLHYESLTPQERRLHDLENENSSFKSKAEKQKEAEEKKEHEISYEKAATQIDENFTDFFQSIKVKPDYATVARMAELCMADLKNDRDFDLSKAYQKVQSEDAKRAPSILEKLIASGKIPPELLKQIRDYDLKELKKTRSTPVSLANPVPSKKKSVNKQQTLNDFFKQNDLIYSQEK